MVRGSRDHQKEVFSTCRDHRLRTAALNETGVKESPLCGVLKMDISKTRLQNQQSTHGVPGTRPANRSRDTLPISESTVLSEWQRWLIRIQCIERSSEVEPRQFTLQKRRPICKYKDLKMVKETDLDAFLSSFSGSHVYGCQR